MMVPSLSPISRTVSCAGRLNCIRRNSPLNSQPEIAFSVERSVRRKGVGSVLFRKLIQEAHAKGYRNLRITTGAQNEPMRALANKFGAHLTFSHGESTGSIDLIKQNRPEFASPAAVSPLEAARTIANINRAYWKMVLQMYGWGRAA